MNQEQNERQRVDRQQFRRRANGCFRPPGKYQRKVEKQSRRQQARHNLRPVNFPVKRVQFSAEMERPENEGNQAKNVKMHGARSVPAANEDEQADEKIEQPHDSQVVLGRKRLFGRGGEKRGFEFLTTTGKFVMYLGRS